MNDPQTIGAFQFENLVKNRVPFLLVNLETDLSNLFTAYYQTHLETQMLATSAATATSDVKKMTSEADHAIVVVSEDGTVAATVAEELLTGGFTNVYAVLGGAKSIRADLGR